MGCCLNLSICIPSYNRPEFLLWTLEKLTREFSGKYVADAVISDDASTERMHDVFQFVASQPITAAEMCIRWIQQRHNLGPFPNLRAVLLEAKNKYAVYCANDDYLLPARVESAVAYLDEHPECAAYIAPCEIWDEVHQKSFWPAFKSEDRTFTWADRMELFNFIILNHVWPEHIIYRTPVPLKPFTRAFWCFASLPDVLATGSIHFSGEPFYHNLLVHPVGDRVQLGNVQCLTYFDEYRAGLEVLAYEFFGEQPYRCRHQIHDMISAFICQRMHNASVLYARAGNMLEAEMLRKRITIANPSRDPAVEAAA